MLGGQPVLRAYNGSGCSTRSPLQTTVERGKEMLVPCYYEDVQMSIPNSIMKME